MITATRYRIEASDQDPVVEVTVENPDSLEAPDPARAQELATGIYKQAGVTLRGTPGERRSPTEV